MKSKALFIFFVLLILLITTGCQGKKEPEVLTLEIASMWNPEEGPADFMKEMAEKYTELTGVQVNIDFAGREVLTKVRSRLSIGESPDLVDQEFDELFAAFIAGEEEPQLLSLDDLLEEDSPDGPKMDDIFDTKFREPYKRNGKNYLLPYYFVTSGFFYNKTIFAEKGLTVPQTWDEFLLWGDQAKTAGLAPLAFDGLVNFYGLYYFSTIAERLLGPGAFLAASLDETGKAWEDPRWREAAAMVHTLSQAGGDFFQPNYQGSSWPAAQKEWAGTNQAAAIYVGSWIALETSEYAANGFDYGYFPFPSVPGGKGDRMDMAGTLFGYAVMKQAKNPGAAKDFLKFISSLENANRYVDISLTMSARKEAKFPSILADIKPYLTSVNQAFSEYDGVRGMNGEWLERVFYSLDDALLFGELSPDDFIQEVIKGSREFYESKK